MNAFPDGNDPAQSKEQVDVTVMRVWDDRQIDIPIIIIETHFVGPIFPLRDLKHAKRICRQV